MNSKSMKLRISVKEIQNVTILIALFQVVFIGAAIGETAPGSSVRLAEPVAVAVDSKPVPTIASKPAPFVLPPELAQSIQIEIKKALNQSKPIPQPDGQVVSIMGGISLTDWMAWETLLISLLGLLLVGFGIVSAINIHRTTKRLEAEHNEKIKSVKSDVQELIAKSDKSLCDAHDLYSEKLAIMTDQHEYHLEKNLKEQVGRISEKLRQDNQVSLQEWLNEISNTETNVYVSISRLRQFSWGQQAAAIQAKLNQGAGGDLLTPSHTMEIIFKCVGEYLKDEEKLVQLISQKESEVFDAIAYFQNKMKKDTQMIVTPDWEPLLLELQQRHLGRNGEIVRTIKTILKDHFGSAKLSEPAANNAE